MKDFTEITLCPEALERSEVGLGQGCHPMGLHSAVPTVPLTIAFVQTEFCNPVFEGEEPLAVPPAEQPPDADGVGATSPQDALGTCMGFTWLCVALMSAVLLFLIALLLGIIIHPCGGTLRGPEGSFSSPNHPGPYPPHALCIWHIEVAAGMAIQLTMDAFSVEGTASCLFDRLELYEEQGARGGTARFCGSVVPPTFNSVSNRLRVTFVSDGSVGAPGFSARYRAVDPSESEYTMWVGPKIPGGMGMGMGMDVGMDMDMDVGMDVDMDVGMDR
ncbi:hypothetical protein CIB84_010757, partial [Bambusicola thoracicus]